MNKSNLAARVCVEIFRDPIDQTYLDLKLEELNDPDFKSKFLEKLSSLNKLDYPYWFKFSQLSEVGSRLRLAHLHESNDHDECWSTEEEIEWDIVSDELVDLFEKRIHLELESDSESDSFEQGFQKIDLILAQLCRAEWPIKWD